MGLTDVKIKQAQPNAKKYKISDGHGLALLVFPNGAKYWRFKYRFGAKEKSLALGVYPNVGLKEARSKRDDAKRSLDKGVDPALTRKLERLQRHVSKENTFEAIAREWHTNQAARWTEQHASTVMRRLEADVFPQLHGRALKEISAPELLATLRIIESRGALDIAHRARSICSQIFRYAIATGKAERDIAADLRGALKLRKSICHARLEESELPEFLLRLEGYDGDPQTKRALGLLVYTFLRTNEVRGARWNEIEFEKAVWVIPSERMKMKRKHLVPLSRQALAILNSQKAVSHNSEFVFPCRTGYSSPISGNTMLYAIYRMGYHSRATSHGFRATASTILNENSFNRDVVERQLAHGERDKVRAAYNYAEYMPERTRMMQWWADHLDSLQAGLEEFQ